MNLKLFVALAAAALIVPALAACGRPVNDFGPSAPTVEYLTEQEVLTPLPLRVRLPNNYGAEHVVVLYRTWGSQGWSQLELARRGQSWTGEISCRQVSTVTGDTKYFFVALDSEGELVGGSGSPDWPHVATIVGKLPGGARGLPSDGTIPMRCHDPADCPPDFPGCPSYSFTRQACRTDRDCKKENDHCAWDGYCGSPSGQVATITGPDGEDVSEEGQLAAAVRAVRNRYSKKGTAPGPGTTTMTPKKPTKTSDAQTRPKTATIP